MLSRVANSIYWMSRYIERAENYARFISVNVHLSYDIPGLFVEHWKSLLDATDDLNSFLSFHSEKDGGKMIEFLTFDEFNPNSIYNCVKNARENARTIREILPKEIWEHLNGFYLNLKSNLPAKNESLENITAFYEGIKEECQLFAGIIDTTLSRNETYYFASLGKFIERADKTSRFIDVGYFNFNPENTGKNVSPQDLLIWSAVLKSASGLNMYRQQYKSLKQESIIEFLIKDRHFPRALSFCINKAENALFRISGNAIHNRYSNLAEKAICQLSHELDFTEVKEIVEIGLHTYLNEFQIKNNQIGMEVFKVYFDLESKLLS